MVSIVIPTYNSAQFIQNTLNSISNIAKIQFQNFEIIVVDDASDDNTKNRIKDTAINNLSLISYENNKGQQKATALGIIQAKGDIIITIDDDLEYSLEDVSKMLKIINKYDLIYGYAINYGNTLIRRFFYKIYLAYSLKYWGFKIASFRCFEKKILNDKELKTAIEGKDFLLDKYLINKTKKIHSVPIQYQSKNNSRYSTLHFISYFSHFFKAKPNQ